MNTIAAPDCYGCLATGRIVGFGCDGLKCPCVAHCEECDRAISWDHDEERAPYLCEACMTEEEKIMEKRIDVGIQRVRIRQDTAGQWYFFPIDVANVRCGDNSASYPTKIAAVVAAGCAWTRMCIVEFPGEH